MGQALPGSEGKRGSEPTHKSLHLHEQKNAQRSSDNCITGAREERAGRDNKGEREHRRVKEQKASKRTKVTHEWSRETSEIEPEKEHPTKAETRYGHVYF